MATLARFREILHSKAFLLTPLLRSLKQPGVLDGLGSFALVEKRCRAERGVGQLIKAFLLLWVFLGADGPLFEQGTLRLLMGLRSLGSRSSSAWTKPSELGELFLRCGWYLWARRDMDLSLI